MIVSNFNIRVSSIILCPGAREQRRFSKSLSHSYLSAAVVLDELGKNEGLTIPARAPKAAARRCRHITSAALLCPLIVPSNPVVRTKTKNKTITSPEIKHKGTFWAHMSSFICISSK